MKETYFQIAEERSECFGFPEWEIQAFLPLSSLVAVSRPKIVPSIYPMCSPKFIAASFALVSFSDGKLTQE